MAHISICHIVFCVRKTGIQLKRGSLNCIYFELYPYVIAILTIIICVMYSTKAQVTHNACWNKGRALVFDNYWCHYV